MPQPKAKSRLLAEMMREKMVLMVTHRLRGLSRFQQIIVMDNGRVLEQGTHAELLARQGAFTSSSGVLSSSSTIRLAWSFAVVRLVQLFAIRSPSLPGRRIP
ncbi:hypothetical protein ACLK1T_02115 [Escherichia coli]